MPPALKRVLKRLNGSWDLPILALGKWHLKHWGWDLATGTGEKKEAYNGNGRDVPIYKPFETFIKSLNA